MVSFLGFGTPEACKIAYEVCTFEFCMPKTKFREMAQASLLQQVGLSHLPELCLRHAKFKSPNLKCNFTGFRSPKSQKGGHFRDQH